MASIQGYTPAPRGAVGWLAEKSGLNAGKSYLPQEPQGIPQNPASVLYIHHHSLQSAKQHHL